MSAEAAVDTLVFLMVVPAVLYPILLGFFSRWWQTHVSRALLIHTIGFALLVAATTLTKLFGPNYPGRHAVLLTILTLLLVGIWYQFIALVVLMRRGGNADG